MLLLKLFVKTNYFNDKTNLFIKVKSSDIPDVNYIFAGIGTGGTITGIGKYVVDKNKNTMTQKNSYCRKKSLRLTFGRCESVRAFSRLVIRIVGMERRKIRVSPKILC